jgi:hypothetical protein
MMSMLFAEGSNSPQINLENLSAILKFIFSWVVLMPIAVLLSSDTTLYNPAVNKRARKRLKEAIEKKNLERQKMLKEQSSASSQTKERRGFTVKPEKKRG